MESVKGSRDGETKKIKIKGVRGISLRACVAKAAGWTLEEANSITSQEASINKNTLILSDVGVHGCGSYMLCYHKFLWSGCDSQNHHPD